MVRAKEADLFALAEAAGKEDGTAPAKEGIPQRRILPGSESRGINQDGEDPGFETRVKTPSKPGTPSAGKSNTAQGSAGKTPGRPRGSAAERTLSDIGESLEEQFAIIFGLVAGAMPVTGMYGIENSPKAIKGILEIAKRRPAVMRALMVVADGNAALEIGKFAAGLAFAVQVDMQRLAPDSLPARVTGVTRIVEKYFMDESPAPNPGVTEQVTHATRFQPVP